MQVSAVRESSRVGVIEWESEVPAHIMKSTEWRWPEYKKKQNEIKYKTLEHNEYNKGKLHFGNFSLMTLSELHVCVDCNACCGSYVTQRQLCKPGSQSLHWPGAAPSGTLSLSVDIPQERGLWRSLYGQLSVWEWHTASHSLKCKGTGNWILVYLSVYHTLSYTLSPRLQSSAMRAPTPQKIPH